VSTLSNLIRGHEMKRRLFLPAILLLAALLAGCGTKSYSIKTNSGHEYIAQGAPVYNVKSDTYTFTDGQGKEVVINKDDIRLIKEK